MALGCGFSTRARSLALAAAATVFALPSWGAPPELDSLHAALVEGRNAWRAAARVDYEYGYRKFCECHPDTPPETVVTVRGSTVVGVRHRPVGFDHDVQAEQRNLQFYWTVDGLFDLVGGAIARARASGASVRASFDPKLGFPTEVFIDYDANFIGDELDVRLTTVTPLAR
jgi:hypothetical protein